MSETTDTTAAANAAAAGQRVGGRFLTFVLAAEEYGVQILKVREIIGLMKITPVPQTPAFVAGVINLRGKVIPVMDLRTRFEMPAVEHTDETCVIVIDTVWGGGTHVLMGIVVDTVREVVDIEPDQIDPTPEFGGGVRTDYILGMGKVAEKVKILLDIDKVLTSEPMVLTQTETQAAAAVADVAGPAEAEPQAGADEPADAPDAPDAQEAE
jgi:purine-binding chemotaxis protein CheW